MDGFDLKHIKEIKGIKKVYGKKIILCGDYLELHFFNNIVIEFKFVDYYTVKICHICRTRLYASVGNDMKKEILIIKNDREPAEKCYLFDAISVCNKLYNEKFNTDSLYDQMIENGQIYTLLKKRNDKRKKDILTGDKLLKYLEYAENPNRYVGSIAESIKPILECKDFKMDKWKRGEKEKMYVTKVENVLNPHSIARFEKKWDEFKELYGENNTKSKITLGYHGTRNDNTWTIVSNGLIIPGKENNIKVASGAKYGVGIYTSPDPRYAASYASNFYKIRRGMKMLVCAVLMGKSYCGSENLYSWFKYPTYEKGYDSYICELGLEYVIYDEVQILPVLVVDFDLEINPAQNYLLMSSAGTLISQPGFVINSFNKEAEESLRAEKMNARIKNASFYMGSRFKQIEVAVSEIDDDDETSHLLLTGEEIDPTDPYGLEYYQDRHYHVMREKEEHDKHLEDSCKKIDLSSIK